MTASMMMMGDRSARERAARAVRDLGLGLGDFLDLDVLVLFFFVEAIHFFTFSIRTDLTSFIY